VPTIELCDEVIFIENGSVKAQGKHKEIIKKDQSYRDLFLEGSTVETAL
jgi:ABC-type multidrug transport system fused ATPase/permease subunit